jgi:parvulin-like peptidyl-prolyl isomerase
MKTTTMSLTLAAVIAAMGFGFAAEPQAAGESAGEAPAVEVGDQSLMHPELRALSGLRALVVNGEEISMDEVRERAFVHHGPYVAQGMIEELLLEQEARRRGVTVSDEEVEARLAALREELGLRSERTLESYLRTYQVTVDWLRQKARYSVLVDKVLAEQVHITDREITQHYQRNQNAFRRGEVVGLRLISFPSEEATESALGELRKGRSFQEVAKEVSQDPSAAELHLYERGQLPPLPPDFELAIFSAPMNQAVVIQAQNAYHLIRVEKKIDPRQFTLDEVRELIQQQLTRQKLEKVVLPNWIRMQLANASIEFKREE